MFQLHYELKAMAVCSYVIYGIFREAWPELNYLFELNQAELSTNGYISMSRSGFMLDLLRLSKILG
jgi:hypothetical protein